MDDKNAARTLEEIMQGIYQLPEQPKTKRGQQEEKKPH